VSPEENGGVWISTKAIYDELVGIRADLQRVIPLLEQQKAVSEDHEIRLRSIERWKYRFPIAAGAGMLTGLAAILTVFIK
jgi:hypothetical protein